MQWSKINGHQEPGEWGWVGSPAPRCTGDEDGESVFQCECVSSVGGGGDSRGGGGGGMDRGWQDLLTQALRACIVYVYLNSVEGGWEYRRVVIVPTFIISGAGVCRKHA